MGSLAANRDITPYLIWVAALILAVTIAGIAIMLLRRRILSKDVATDAQSALLNALREMRNQGRMSVEEYDAARKRLTARFAGAHAPTAPAPPRPASRPPTSQERRARPGFDLTGAPLPKPDDRPAEPL